MDSSQMIRVMLRITTLMAEQRDTNIDKKLSSKES